MPRTSSSIKSVTRNSNICPLYLYSKKDVQQKSFKENSNNIIIRLNNYHVLFLISQETHQFFSWTHWNSHLLHIVFTTQQLRQSKQQ